MSSALSITPQERLIALKPIFLLFMFIALIFETIYAPVCLFVWKTLSGVRLGMEPSTKYQKHSPGTILSATLQSSFKAMMTNVLRNLADPLLMEL